MRVRDRSWLIFVAASVLLILVVFSLAGLRLYLWHETGAAGSLGLTQQERRWLELNGDNIRICAEPYTPPLAMVRHGKITGMVSDYYRLINARLGIELKQVPASSFADMLAMARLGQVDIVGPVARTPERAQYLLFSQPVIEYPVVIVVERANRRNLRLRDMRGLRIAVTKDYAVWDYLWRYYPDLNYVPVADDSVGMKMVAFRQVDAALTDLGTASYTISHQNLGNLRIAGEVDFRYVLSFASRRDRPELNAILIKVMASIPQHARDEIYRRWVPLEISHYFFTRRTLMALVGVLFGILAALAFVVVWNQSLSRRVAERTAELNAYRDQLEVRVAERTAELSAANAELASALAEVRILSGFIPVCSCCKKLRDDEGYWKQVEDYLAHHSNVLVTHGICPECLRKNYPEYADDENSPDDVGKA